MDKVNSARGAALLLALVLVIAATILIGIAWGAGAVGVALFIVAGAIVHVIGVED